MKSSDLRRLLTGGDRRSIAQSDRVRALVEKNPELVEELAGLTEDHDWLVSERSGPPGFDPLGPAKDRRAAVDKYVESLDSKAP